jgi:hypothetical protein
MNTYYSGFMVISVRKRLYVRWRANAKVMFVLKTDVALELARCRMGKVC